MLSGGMRGFVLFLQMGGDAKLLLMVEELAEAGLVGEHFEGCVGFDDDEEVVAFGDFVLYEAVGFADSSLDEVALDRVAAAAADGDGEGGGEIVRAAEGVDSEGMGGA